MLVEEIKTVLTEIEMLYLNQTTLTTISATI